jgi:hypothetical protein
MFVDDAAASGAWLPHSPSITTCARRAQAVAAWQQGQHGLPLHADGTLALLLQRSHLRSRTIGLGHGLPHLLALHSDASLKHTIASLRAAQLALHALALPRLHVLYQLLPVLLSFLLPILLPVLLHILYQLLQLLPILLPVLLHILH